MTETSDAAKGLQRTVEKDVVAYLHDGRSCADVLRNFMIYGNVSRTPHGMLVCDPVCGYMLYWQNTLRMDMADTPPEKKKFRR